MRRLHVRTTSPRHHVTTSPHRGATVVNADSSTRQQKKAAHGISIEDVVLSEDVMRRTDQEKNHEPPDIHRYETTAAPLGAVGRMALTNYLMQSVVFVLLFFGYGLGWYGKVAAFGGLMLAIALFALQIVASQWWLRRFRFGPAEWLWRSLTYGKPQPMRTACSLAGEVADAK